MPSSGSRASERNRQLTVTGSSVRVVLMEVPWPRQGHPTLTGWGGCGSGVTVGVRHGFLKEVMPTYIFRDE